MNFHLNMKLCFKFNFYFNYNGGKDRYKKRNNFFAFAISSKQCHFLSNCSLTYFMYTHTKFIEN